MRRILQNLAHLRASAAWEPEPAARSQARLAHALVSAARADVPLYRDLYADATLPPAAEADEPGWFTALPLVTRDIFKAAFPDRIVSRRYRPTALRPVATSGVTDRLMTFHDGAKRDWDRAADLLLALDGDHYRPGRSRIIIPPDACYERCGADEHGRTQSVGSRLRALLADDPRRLPRRLRELAAQMVRDWVWREKLLPAFGIDGTATRAAALDDYLARIGRIAPHALYALPMFLHVLAERAAERGPAAANPRVPVLRPSGGKITPRTIARVEQAFRGRVRENFGTAELGTIAFDCPTDRRQHLLTELFHVEFLRGGRPVAPGAVGELVVTDLRNHAAPLIRYALGDVGRHWIERCRCGRHTLLFTVHGRLSETVVTPAGDAFCGDELTDFFLAEPAIRFARLLQQSDERFVLEYVRRADHAPPDAAALAAEFGMWLGRPARLELREVRRIAPERSGKFALARSTSWQRFHEPTTPQTSQGQDRARLIEG